jgi:hypothetical protein
MFWAVFSVFLAATLVLIFFTIRWAFRQDRLRRRAGAPKTPTTKD